MEIITESISIDGVGGCGAASCPRGDHSRRVGTRTMVICWIAGLLALTRCAPPTEVVDVRQVPQATGDAMVHVKILPLGMPAPPGVGSISPISGYACAQTREAASSEAVRQLQVKALSLHATAVVNVLIGAGGETSCLLGFGMLANGTAVAPRGIPSSY